MLAVEIRRPHRRSPRGVRTWTLRTPARVRRSWIGREPARVAVGGVDLAVVGHHRGERQRLAAAAGAEVDHLLAGPHRRQERRELRALVLDLDPALDECRLGLDRRAAPVRARRDAQAERRERRLDGAEMRQGVVRLARARAAFRVLTRRSSGARAASACSSANELVAEDAPRGTARAIPGKSPATASGRVGEVGLRRAARAPRRSRAPARSARRRTERAMASRFRPALQRQHAEDIGTRRRLAHEPARPRTFRRSAS